MTWSKDELIADGIKSVSITAINKEYLNKFPLLDTSKYLSIKEEVNLE